MPHNLVRARLECGSRAVDAWVARTTEQRKLGLMHCQNLRDDEGMLFVCDECAVQRFWMKDTPLPLSIAFLDEDGTVLHVDDMEPESTDTTTCEHPVRYILEVRQGWFQENGVGRGDRFTGPVFHAVVSAGTP